MRQDVIERLRPLAGGLAPEIGERAGYKCEYCDRDMLASLSAFNSWVHDHIIPRSAGGEDSFENLALCCQYCNGIKYSWNPGEKAGKDASRKELIKIVREHFAEKGMEKLKEFREIVGWK